MNRPTPYAYLDNAATTPLKPAAREAMLAALETFGNPSSVHAEGQKARGLVDDARRAIADKLGVRAERVIFTSGGTEANNLALSSALKAAPGKRALVSAVEHDCVLAFAQRENLLPVDENGVVRIDVLEAELAKGDVAVVAVMHANNETGVLQPLAEVVRLCRAHGVLCHTDAVQTVGHLNVRPDDLGADTLAFSAHKFGGPKGAGALVVRPEIFFAPQMIGGGQERGRRAGTEDVPGIAGMAAALEQNTDTTALMQRLVAGLKQSSDVEIVAEKAEKVPHVLQLRVPGKNGEDLVMAMDLAGVAVSQGSACSSGRVKASHVLKAMGYTEAEAGEGLRLSLGWSTTDADIDAALDGLRRILA